MSRRNLKDMLNNWEDYDTDELTYDDTEYTKFREPKQTKKKRRFENERKKKQKEHDSLLEDEQ